MTAWLPTATWVGLVVSYAALANVWNRHDPGWYAGLARPSFMPPDAVFAVMWPLNFALLLAVGVWFTRGVGAGTAWAGVALLAASVAAALVWAWLFYVPHRLGPAALALGGATVLTWCIVALVARALPWAGLTLVPYAGWLTVAAALSVQYARMDGPDSTIDRDANA